jgi:hypothetical protein
LLRKLFGLKIEKVTRGWNELLNEELHSLYSSSDINLQGRDHFGDIGVDWKINLDWILKEWGVRRGLYSIGLG